MLKRNPRAFNPKFAKGSPTKETVAGAKHVKGCNCKNSKCQRNYCECFAMGVACHPKCRCENCENGKHGPQPPGEDAASEAQLAEYAATHAENHIIFDVEPFAVADGYRYGGGGAGAGGAGAGGAVGVVGAKGERGGGHAAQAAGADAEVDRHSAVHGLLGLVCDERGATDDASAMPPVSGNPSLVVAAL